MDARVENIDDIHVVALRHVGPFHLIGSKFEQLGLWAGVNGVPVQGSLGIWHDDPSSVPPAELRSDACLVVPEDYLLPEAAEGFGPRLDTVYGGDYAVGTHLGSYEGLGDAWSEFSSTVVPKLGRNLRKAPSFEIYVNDCRKVPVEEVRTDLYQPLEPI